MKSKLTKDFLDRFAKLPATIQEQAREAYRTFKDNPSHPGLRLHKVSVKKSNKTLYSISIGLHYRALAQENGGILEWFWIGHHSVYDKILEGR